jgi:hypothetical protein
MARTQPTTFTKDVASTDDIKLDDVQVDLDKAKSSGVDEVVVPVEADISKLMKVDAFYAEKVLVAFAEPATENETPFVEANVNGHVFVHRRDMQPVEVPRIILEYIARAKTMRVRTERKVLEDGSETMVPKVTYSPDYPFTVLHDPSGAKGVAWLKSVLSQPG